MKFRELIILQLLALLLCAPAQASINAWQFFEMIENNDLTGVMLATRGGFEINKIYHNEMHNIDGSTDGRTPLWCAIRHAKPQMAELLLNAGADTEMKGANDVTPLMTAMIWAEIYHSREKYPPEDRANSMRAIDILLARGADVNYSGTYGRGEGMTPLGFAVSIGDYSLSLEITKKLLSAGADVNQRVSPEGPTPLCAALANILNGWEESGRENRLALIKLLLDAGADPNIMFDGYTPLHMAIAFDRDLTEALLDTGADRHTKSRDGLTPLEGATRNLKNF